MVRSPIRCGYLSGLREAVGALQVQGRSVSKMPAIERANRLLACGDEDWMDADGIREAALELRDLAVASEAYRSALEDVRGIVKDLSRGSIQRIHAIEARVSAALGAAA